MFLYAKSMMCCRNNATAHVQFSSLSNPYQVIFIFKRCKFQVGSYSYDDTKMIFLESGRVKGYVETSRSIVLDYDVKINPLSPKVTYMIIQIQGDIYELSIQMCVRFKNHIYIYITGSGTQLRISGKLFSRRVWDDTS